MGKSNPFNLPIEEIAIPLLMARSSIPWRMKLSDEERLSVDFADRMRLHVRDGNYKGIWTKIANEGKRHPLTALLFKAMGMISGSSDFVFTGPWGNLWMELKLKKAVKPQLDGSTKVRYQTEQSEYQEYFQYWCQTQNVPYVVCRSIEEAEQALIDCGALNIVNP